jgi:3'-5' exoribonuclease
MEKRQFIGELGPGALVEDVFLLASARMNQARNGPYWRVEFRDTSGKMEGKIWSPVSQKFPELKPGCLVCAQGRVVVYRERNEIAVDDLRLLTEEEQAGLDLADFVASGGCDAETMLQELEKLCRKNFVHQPWIKFYRTLFGDDELMRRLRLAPAAKGMHHAYAGGLLEHTLGVCRLCLALSSLYPHLDKQTLLAGALCHDLGKIWELSSGLLAEYTSPGRLLGHISLGVEKLEPLMRKSDLEEELILHLKHLILSHHGIREFGSPVPPATAEAMALHYADNIDAKLNQVQGALEGIAPGEDAWSGYVPGLDRLLYRALPSPGGAEADPAPAGEAAGEDPEPAGNRARTAKNIRAGQCLLLLKE